MVRIDRLVKGKALVVGVLALGGGFGCGDEPRGESVSREARVVDEALTRLPSAPPVRLQLPAGPNLVVAKAAPAAERPRGGARQGRAPLN